MSLKKHGILVGCENCSCSSSDGSGGFEVIVPIRDSETGIKGTAKLYCRVSPDRHQVSLRAWHGASLDAEAPSATMRQRLSAALAFVADQRVCGNRRICPPAVVRIVEEQHSR